MPDTQHKFMTLDVWEASQSWIHQYIDSMDAKSIKTVALSKDKRNLLFYKIENPAEDSLPAFTIEIPEADLSTVIQKVSGATADNVPVLNADGTIKDSGVAITAIAKTEDIMKEVNRLISEADHISKVIVEALPSAEEAKSNVFYLVKKEVGGTDKYEVWTKIGAELVLIDDTSVNLDGYATKEELKTSIETAKSEAAADAKTKADQALADAKQYTDTSLSPVNQKVTEIENNVGTLTTKVTSAESTLNEHGDRIVALESGIKDMNVATEEECKAAFDAIFYPGLSS